jgi:aldehyde dehydrogenase (NAD+)
VETDVTDKSLENSTLGSLQYDPAPESAAIARLKPSYGLFIDGKFTDPSTHEQFASLNPATEETLAMISFANAADVDRAVAVARNAYDTAWSKTTGAERAKYLFRIARLILERSRELAVVETLDNGKPIRESRDIDIPLAAAHFFYYAGWADKLDHAGFGVDPKPIGVAGQIIPWNFPCSWRRGSWRRRSRRATPVS